MHEGTQPGLNPSKPLTDGGACGVGEIPKEPPNFIREGALKHGHVIALEGLPGLRHETADRSLVLNPFFPGRTLLQEPPSVRTTDDNVLFGQSIPTRARAREDNQLDSPQPTEQGEELRCCRSGRPLVHAPLVQVSVGRIACHLEPFAAHLAA